jgi:hypothetical protein
MPDPADAMAGATVTAADEEEEEGAGAAAAAAAASGSRGPRRTHEYPGAPLLRSGKRYIAVVDEAEDPDSIFAVSGAVAPVSTGGWYHPPYPLWWGSAG